MLEEKLMSTVLRLLYRIAILAIVVLPMSGVVAQGPADTLLRSTLTGDISTLNWALVSDSASIDVSAFLWAGLFEADPKTAQPQPALATWKVSEDGLTYNFTLRDAVWSDDKPITSKDVKFIYDAINSDKVQSPRKADLALISKFNIIDDKNFEIVLSQPNCTVWGNAFGVLRPIPSHKYAADFSDFMTSPFNTQPDVTSGPYLVKERKAGEFIRLEANPKYYKGAPKIPVIINRVLTDTAVINQALQAGEIDYAFMYPDQAEQIAVKDNLNINALPLNNTPLLWMNYQDSTDPQPAYDKDGKPNTLKPNKFFADKRVRQAVAMGYDKSAIMKTLGPNGGFLLSGPITPAFEWVGADEVKPWPYDPKRAAELLDEAGWKMNTSTGVREKDGVPFEVKLVYAPLVDLYTNIATVAQDQLKQIGIKLDVSTLEWSAYLKDVLLPCKYDMTIVGFGGGSEVDGIAYNIMHSKNAIPNSAFNMAFYVNPKMDELLDKGRSMVGCKLEDRAAVYREIQKIAHDDVAYDFTVGTNQVHVMNKRVQGYQPGPWNTYVAIETWSIGAK
jgi:peptide/nickel transport system substrate-binding protein